MKARTQPELIRLALHYAIEERQGWLACTEGYTTSAEDAEAVLRACVLVDEWRALLAKKYGERPMSERAPLGESVPLTEVMNAEPRDFDAAMLPLSLRTEPNP